MNESKVCFISCIDNEVLYEECKRYLKALDIPNNFEIEIVAIPDANNIAEGYNRAMRQSDAKYKVYLQQETFILNKGFIGEVVQLFTNYPKLGLIGVVGIDEIPLDSNWNSAKGKRGKVYDYSTEQALGLSDFGDFSGAYHKVKAIEGILMVTQHDLPWREDIVTHWDGYDLSQSCEFTRAGYDVGVAKQNTPWCIYDNTNKKMHTSREQAQRFANEYHKDLFPLVSILIPTYNRPEYFRLALESVLAQTYKNLEIVICDDSTNDETQALIAVYLSKYSNIRYYKNEKNMGQFLTDLKLMNLAHGEYINFLMDDDLFHPEKISKMMKVFIEDVQEHVSMVTSHRQIIDQHENYMQDWLATKRIFSEDTVVDGITFGEFVLRNVTNFIGEPTTVLFRKQSLTEQFGSFSGRDYGCAVDLASWLNLLSVGDIVYMSESLSYFRVHAGQQLQNMRLKILGRIDFANLIVNSRKKGFFKSKAMYASAIENGIQYIEGIMSKISASDKQSDVYNELLESMRLLKQEKALLIG